MAVRNMSLTAYSGEVLGLLGPNGAGKTTALNVLIADTAPTKGKVMLFVYRSRVFCLWGDQTESWGSNLLQIHSLCNECYEIIILGPKFWVACSDASF